MVATVLPYNIGEREGAMNRRVLVGCGAVMLLWIAGISGAGVSSVADAAMKGDKAAVRTDFDRVYDDFLDPLAPETVPQHWLVWNSAILTWEVMRYRRMKVSYMLNQRRAAVGALIRQAFQSTSMRAVRKGGSDIDDNIERYFSDPAYRPLVGQALEQAGYSADAAEAEAFARSLNGLSQFERLIASAEKRLMLFFREMDRIHGDRAIRAQNIANNALA